MPTRGRPAKLGLTVVFLWFAIGGVAHFALTALEMRIVPPYIPWPRAAVLVSGVFELAGAAGLLWRPTRRAAGIGLFVLTLCVTPAHFYMLQRPDLFAVPYWALLARLPLQIALLALIWWSALLRPRDPRTDAAAATLPDRVRLPPRAAPRRGSRRRDADV
jgi:uncharacterized membrane protein